VDNIRYDYIMNSGKQGIEDAFGSLRNMWHILKHFNSRIDRILIVTIACCDLHN
jgi:hypothetical protein